MMNSPLEIREVRLRGLLRRDLLEWAKSSVRSALGVSVLRVPLSF
jgi:hypothetical protein